MTPVIPGSTSNLLLFPETVYTTKNFSCLTRFSSSQISTKHPLYFSLQRFSLPPATSVGFFPQYRRACALRQKSRMPILSASGTDVALEEPNSPVASEESTEESSIKQDVSPPSSQTKRIRNVRKSEMPPIKNEELVPGATFTGKVRSIQPFGAFVDFGAFTDGLVHVSNLSDGFVKDVGTFVSIGQEVKVRLVEANTETGRISLTMRENDDVQERKGAPRSDKSRPARRNPSNPGQRKDEVKKFSKFVKGQNLEGTVKNLARSGAFISLPEGEEGFLHTSEEADDGLGSMMGGSSLQVGQEVSVRVLRISRGQVTLTMKNEENPENLDSEVTQGVVYAATNPFNLAFRQNKEIASFLDERKKMEKAAEMSAERETSGEPEAKISQTETVTGVSDIIDVQDETAEGGESPSEEADEKLENVDAAIQTIEKEPVVSSEILSPEGSVSTEDQIIIESDEKPESSAGISEIPSSESPAIEVEESQVDVVLKDETQRPEPVNVDGASETVEKEPVGTSEILTPESSVSIEDQKIEETTTNDVVESDVRSVLSEEMVNQIPSSETPHIEVEESKVDDPASKYDQIEMSSPKNEIPSAALASDVEPVPENVVPSPEETKAAISPSLVKQLREETGAGMMDCKKALAETEGDIVKAQEFLRKKGLSSAEKKASRATSEGRIGSYIHDSRIGVLVEVNCETDFVSRGDIFKELVDDLAMQVAAYPQVQYLVREDVPEELVNKEREIEMQKEDLLSKPEQIRSKIVEGRIRKRLDELALVEQPYIKNDKVVVKDWIKQTIATVGENMKVRRFVRFNLGEGLEKKSQDFAAEVAAQTAAKPVPPQPGTEQPAAAEAVEKSPPPATATISASLVKKLREETGAGMMDCKKALSETAGDLVKAQEYLRKKGLSAADKKSSRIAAEGRIGSYIHDSRIGVLIEVNCETDFVGRSDKFKELVDDLAMQVVACPTVQFVSIEEISEDIIKKEKEIEMQRDDLASKPENIREKIVEGRVSKRLGELALLEQPFIKNDSVLVKDLVKQTVAALGESIKVRRFVRFTLGEQSDAKTEA